MLKKYIALFFLTFAYAILLGHSIVPHHHHDNEHELAQHHLTGHHHHEDQNEEGLNHLFSHFLHSDDAFTFIANQSIGNEFSKRLFSFLAVQSGNFSFDVFYIPTLPDKLPAEELIYVSPHSLSSGLRAPPAFIS